MSEEMSVEERHLAVMAERGLVKGRCCEKCGMAGDNYDVHIDPDPIREFFREMP